MFRLFKKKHINNTSDVINKIDRLKKNRNPWTKACSDCIHILASLPPKLSLD